MHTSDIKSWDKLPIEDKRIYLRAFFMDGSIKRAARAELEDFFVMLAMCPGREGHHADREELERFGTVVQHLLQVRISEELHWRSYRLAVWAIIISGLAALMTIIQAFHSAW